MSGHSKWATTKHKKAVIDAKRGKLFAKLIKNIEVAARMGGADPEGNPTLYDAIQKAKKQSVPNKNIDSAVKRGAGLEAGGADGPRGRPRHHVGDTQPVRQQLVLLLRRQPARGEAGAVQGGPEAVAGAREVVAGGGRHQARVDAAEQHPQTVRDHVRHEAVAGGLKFLLGEAPQRIAPGV